MIIEFVDLPPDTEICPTCPETVGPQPIGNFGVAQSRPSGRNLYCKACVRERMKQTRRNLREREAQRSPVAKKNLPLIGLVSERQIPDCNQLLTGDEIRNPRHPHHQRVLSAIHQGARTRKEIADAIRPRPIPYTSRIESTAGPKTMDQVGDSLALLMFGEPRKIKSAIVDGLRVFVAVVTGPPATAGGSDKSLPPTTEPLSFSVLGGVIAPTSDGARLARRAAGEKSDWKAA